MPQLKHTASKPDSTFKTPARQFAQKTGLALLLCAPGFAAAQNSAIASASRSADPLKFFVAGDVTLSDNVGLRSSNKQSGSIWRVTPGLSWDHQSGNLKSHLGLAWSLSTSNPSNGSDTSQLTLDSSLQAAFLQRDLLVDVTGRIANQSTSLFGTQTPAGSSGTGASEVQTRFFSVSPSYRQHIGGWDYLLRYDLSHSDASNNALASSLSQGVSASINNGRSSSFLVTTLSGSTRRYDATGLPSYTTSNAQLREDWRVNNQLNLFISGGREYSGYLGQNQSNSTYDAGFGWQPGPRTSVSASAGHRFYGTNHSVALNHHTRRTYWQLSSSKSASHMQDSFGLQQNMSTTDFLNQFTNPADRAVMQALLMSLNGGVLPANVSLLSNVLSDSQVVSERQSLSSTWLGVNNTVSLSMFRSTTTAISNTIINGVGFSSLGNKILQRGYSAVWSHKLNARSNASLSYTQVQNRAVSTGQDSKAATISLNYSRQLSPKTSVGTSIRHFKSTTTGSGAVTENAVTANIRTEF